MRKIVFFPFALLLALFAMAQTPVAYYPLNGNANDASGNALNGTIIGTVTPVADRFGNANSAMSFPGSTSSYIQIADNPLLRPTSITISCWVNVTSAGVINTFVQKALSPCTNDGWFSGTEGGNFSCYVSNSFTCGDMINLTTPRINNLWKFIVFTVDVVGDTRKLYVDGVLVATGVYTSTLQYDANPVLLGAHIENGVLAFPLLGSLDEVKIFNTALTAAQVQQQYNQTNYSSQFNNSVKMNGVNDFITVPHNAALSLVDFTVEAWVKTTQAIAFSRFVIKEVSGDQNYSLLMASGKASVRFDKVGSGIGGIATGVTNINDGRWHFVSGTYSQSLGELKIYVDGILEGTTSTSFTPITGVTTLHIGTGDASIATQRFNGNMDEVRLWNTARTQAQIVANMNTQLTGSEAGLVGYWDMNRNGQGAGLTVDNKATATGAALNGTTVGTASTPIFAPAVTQQKPGSGNAISFDGVDDVVAVTHNSSLNFPADLTVETWIKIPSGALGGSIIEKWGGNNLAIGYPFVLRFSQSIHSVGFARYNGASSVGINGFSIVDDNKWHHVSATKNGSLLSLYIDGILQGTVADYTDLSNVNNTQSLGIGYGGAPFTDHLLGTIDEVLIWNTGLSQAQIRDRMCQKITAADALYPNLVAYYNFDESTGLTAFDGTINNNNGTLTNSPTRLTSGAAIGTASSHDYVNATKTTSLTHPTGESFTVTSTSGSPDGIHVYRVDEKPNTLTGTTGVGANDKYFGVFQVNGTTPQYTAVYNYNGNPNVNAGNESPLRLNKRNDNAATSWTTMVAIPNELANTITVTGESTEYILGTLGTPLPLNLISFSGSKQNNDALLQWKTSNEIGVNKFEIQRSDNGQSFATIGTVAAGGSMYSLTDANTFSSREVVFYRLKSIDVDARFTYSNILKLSKQTSAALTVYPNPVSDVLTINGLKQNGTVLLYNAYGKLLQQQTVSAQTMTMDMSKYAKGIYLLQYKTGEAVVNQQIIKQ